MEDYDQNDDYDNDFLNIYNETTSSSPGQKETTCDDDRTYCDISSGDHTNEDNVAKKGK